MSKENKVGVTIAPIKSTAPAASLDLLSSSCPLSAYPTNPEMEAVTWAPLPCTYCKACMSWRPTTCRNCRQLVFLGLKKRLQLDRRSSQGVYVIISIVLALRKIKNKSSRDQCLLSRNATPLVTSGPANAQCAQGLYSGTLVDCTTVTQGACPASLCLASCPQPLCLQVIYKLI